MTSSDYLTVRNREDDRLAGFNTYDRLNYDTSPTELFLDYPNDPSYWDGDR